VGVERLQSVETVEAFRTLMEYLGHTSFDAVMGLEIGGANGMEAFLVGSSRFFNAPVIDADCKCLSSVPCGFELAEAY
jgi:DUF917 family protein